MADLEETAVWRNTVYQIETDDPVVGGPPNAATKAGVPNIPNQQLADRTAWLKGQVENALAKLTAAELLKALLTVDGAGSKLDADLLDGLQAADFIRKSREGAGNGLDADTLDGLHRVDIARAGDLKIVLDDEPPPGTLELDGSEILKADYPDLVARSGPFLKPGSTADHARLIDMRGEGIRGWDNGRGVDVGRALGSWQDHALGLLASTNGATTNSLFVSTARRPARPVTDSIDGLASDVHFADGGASSVSRANAGGRFAAETRMRNVSFLICIWY